MPKSYCSPEFTFLLATEFTENSEIFFNHGIIWIYSKTARLGQELFGTADSSLSGKGTKAHRHKDLFLIADYADLRRFLLATENTEFTEKKFLIIY